MAIYFQHDLDYVYFAYGLAFVLVAAICAVIPRESTRGIPWTWLGGFGLAHGVTEWLEIIALDLQDTPAFGSVRFAVTALSFVFLCEFGRRTLGNLQCRGPGRWIYLPLLALAASGALGGFASLQATTRYALALFGGLWAAWALYRLEQKDERSRGFLAAAAMGTAAYALAAGVIVPKAPFFPASILNADGFHSAVGVPIQLFRAALGVLIATALWAYSGRLRRIDLSAAESRGVAPLGYGLAIMLAVTLTAGWRVAEFASDWSDDEVRDILQVQAGTAAAGFTPEELAPLRENTLDRDDANYRHLREQMQAVNHANPDVRSERLLVLRGGRIIEVVTVDAKNPGRSESRVAYERPPKELLEAFSAGKVTTLGPYRGDTGDLVSAFAPIRDSHTHAVAGVLGIDISAEDWKHSVAQYRLTAMFVALLLVLLVIYFFIVRERTWRSAQLNSRSETRLAAAQRMAHIGSWSYDHWSGRIVWSEEMFRIYGRDPALGALVDPKQLKALTHPQDWPRLRTAMREAIGRGADYQLEFRVLRPDGSLRQVEATAHASRGDNGKVIALTGTVQDITERRRTEEALRDSVAQLRLFADNVPAMTVSLDANLRFIFANKLYADFFGVDPADIVGKHLREVVGEEAYGQIECHFAQALQGQAVTYQRTRRLANGEPRYLEVNLLPHVGDHGKVLGCFVVTTDITAHKQAEQALRDSVAQLRLFADNVPAMTVSWDENLRCRFANKAFIEYFGLTAEDVIGRHVSELLGEDVYREIEGYFVQALQGHAVSYQRTRKLADGDSRFIEVKLLPQIGDQGKVLGCFAVTTDITEHKLVQERIQRVAHHDSLTGLPNRLLFNDRLSQAISLAKRDAHQFALLYLDLDRFKAVNDSLGHTAGDELLQAVAARIRRQVRASDTVARVGGDEFTVILSDVARREDAEKVARKIIAAIAAPFQLGSEKHGVDIGTSVGIALYPADAGDADALVKAADAAMYGAKQAGSSFRFFAAQAGAANTA